MLELGGYFNAVEEGFFVDSGILPERNGDGIARKIDGGIGAGTISSAKLTTWLPSPHTTATTTLSSTIRFCRQSLRTHRRCTLECPEKIIYIDELDETDNCHVRMEESKIRCRRQA